MDVVLEAFDTYLFDHLYATVLPASKHQVAPHALQDFARNATITSPGELSAFHTYRYHPASEYLSFEPSEWAYMSTWTRDNIWRQALTLYLITWLFGFVVYFLTATLSYVFVFDKTTVNHPKYLKNQKRLEIVQTLKALPVMAIFTVPFFLAEVRGYSKMYDDTASGPGLWYNYVQFPLFITFTDFFIYWIHRGLHYPLIYKRLHKPHHKWIMPTPFASHAFHPLDGFAQSLPYHVFPFVFPLQKFAYIALFTFINIWTVMIHDGEYVADSPIINGAACHSIHHAEFSWNFGQFTTLWDRCGGTYRRPHAAMFKRKSIVNYGQFTTLWDRLGGSYRKPNDELLRTEERMSAKDWKKQTAEMQRAMKGVEGEGDRTYEPGEGKKVQ